MQASSRRVIQNGNAYFKHHKIDELKGTNPLLHDMGSVFDTIIAMAKVVKLSLADTKSLVSEVKGKSLEETCKNIWNYAYNHYQYKLDNPGIEELRTPLRSWKDRESGIDCDDFSILVSSILTNLKIKHFFRMAKYNGKNYFQHIYVVVPSKEGADMSKISEYFTIDPVVDKFNYEVPYSDKHDKAMMPIQMLNGLGYVSPIAGYLAGQDRIMTFGNEFAGLGDFSGLQGVEATPDLVAKDFLFRTKKHLINTYEVLKKNPLAIPGGTSYLKWLPFLLENFDDPIKRDAALAELEKLEDQQGLSGFSGLGGFFKNIGRGIKNVARAVAKPVARAGKFVGRKTAQAAKFVGQKTVQAAKAVANTAKDVGKFLLKVNPLSVAIRAALRLAMKINLFKQAERLGYGYWTEQEAVSKGMNLTEWRKLRDKLTKVENTYKDLQGKPEELKKNIIAGWDKGTKKHGLLRGVNGFEGLGIEPVSATAGTAAASGVLVKIATMLKDVDWGSLFKGVKSIVQKPDYSQQDEIPQDYKYPESEEAFESNAAYYQKTPAQAVASTSNMNMMIIGAAGVGLLGLIALRK